MQLRNLAAELFRDADDLEFALASVGDVEALLLFLPHCFATRELAFKCLELTVVPRAHRDASYTMRSWHYFTTKADFAAFFRFEAADMQRVFTALEIPDVLPYTEANGTRRRVNGKLAFTALLYRLATGARATAVNAALGLKRTALSRLCCALLDFLFERWYRVLFASDLRRWAPHFPRWADAAWRKQQSVPGAGGRGHRNVVAFIDGHLNNTARPDAIIQEDFYNNQHKHHGLKFLVTFGVNAIILDVVGGCAGRHNDQWLLGCGELLRRWDACLQWTVGRTMHGVYDGLPFSVTGDASWVQPGYILYGDAGFNVSTYLQCPFKASHGELGPAEEQLNSIMCRPRIANEWVLGRMHTLWPALGQETLMQIGNGYVTKYFIAAAMLTNAHTCLYGYQSNDFFGVLPPALEEYFGGAPNVAACPRPWYDYEAEYDRIDVL